MEATTNTTLSITKVRKITDAIYYSENRDDMLAILSEILDALEDNKLFYQMETMFTDWCNDCIKVATQLVQYDVIDSYTVRRMDDGEWHVRLRFYNIREY